MNKQLTPHDFQRLFEEHALGQEILAHLVARYGNAGFVKGGDEANREMCYRIGQRSVLDYILAMINRANGLDE